MTAFAIVGLVVSSYLAYLSTLPPTSCPIGEVGILSCNDVIYSKYAYFYGVSVASLGLGWFIIVTGLIVLSSRDVRFIRWLVAWSILGAAGVVAFVYTEVFLVASICPLCTIAHLSGLAILAISILHLRADRNRS
jgi:uncharacterized membrane protein